MRSTAGFWEGVRARMASDPSFAFKLATEVFLDEIITTATNLAARGFRFWLWSLDVTLQVASQMLVAAFNDIALVFFLAPVAHTAGEKAPPAHAFEPGAFTLQERVMAWVNKWRLYSAIGAVTGYLSMFLTAVLSKEPSLMNAAVWARAALIGCLHLGVSANTRYQLINGLEVLIYRLLPTSLARLGSVIVRFANNCAGSFSWILLSDFIRSVWII
jgi:Protein RETICULATA-related